MTFQSTCTFASPPPAIPTLSSRQTRDVVARSNFTTWPSPGIPPMARRTVSLVTVAVSLPLRVVRPSARFWNSAASAPLYGGRPRRVNSSPLKGMASL